MSPDIAPARRSLVDAERLTRLRGAAVGDSRRHNAAAIVQRLRMGPSSRAELAIALGLAQPTVGKIVALLAQEGIVAEAEAVSGRLGRPRTPLVLRPDAGCAVGVHIGLRTINAGIVDVVGNATAPVVRTRRGRGPTAALRQVGVIADELAERAGPRLLGLGVTAGGWIDPASGVLRSHEALDWHDVDVAGALGRVGVSVESSLRAHAQAEMWFGAARAQPTFVELFVGELIEAAIVVDGVIHTGRRGAAGVLTDMLVPGPGPGAGHSRRLGDVSTGSAVIGRAQRELGLSIADLRELEARAADDPGLQRLQHERLEALGFVVARLIDLFDPPLVVLSGRIADAPEEVRAVARAAAAYSRQGDEEPDVVASALGAGSLAISSASPVLGGFYGDPVGVTRARGAR